MSLYTDRLSGCSGTSQFNLGATFSHHVGDVVGPGAGAVDHVLRLDGAVLGFNSHNLPAVERVIHCQDVGHWAMFNHLDEFKHKVIFVFNSVAFKITF